MNSLRSDSMFFLTDKMLDFLNANFIRSGFARAHPWQSHPFGIKKKGHSIPQKAGQVGQEIDCFIYKVWDMNYGLKEEVIKKIGSLFSNYAQIEKVILYGSRAKGNFTDGSDIDLTLIGNGLEFNTLLKILTDIDNLMLPYKFDISLYNSISDVELLDHIKRVGKYLYIKGSENGK